MTTNTGKQAAAAAAKTLLADRAEEAVTTARAAAATTAQQARDAYDTAKTGGWTAAELTKAGLRAPNPARPRKNKNTKSPQKTTGSDVPATPGNDAAGAA